MLTAFISANLLVALLPATGPWGLRWPWFSTWVDHLDSESDTSLGNSRPIALWLTVVESIHGEIRTIAANGNVAPLDRIIPPSSHTDTPASTQK